MRLLSASSSLAYSSQYAQRYSGVPSIAPVSQKAAAAQFWQMQRYLQNLHF